MSTVIGESYPYPMECAHRRRIEVEAVIPLLASGAVGTPLILDDPGITITRTGAGTYNLTFPAGADLGGFPDGQVAPSTGALRSVYFTAFAPNLGTATAVTMNGSGTATDSAGGDTLRLQFYLNARKDF